MIINKLNPMRFIVLPDKADSPLLIDANAVLFFARTMQFFQLIAGWNTQKVETKRRIKQLQFTKRSGLYIRRKNACLTGEPEIFGFFICETDDHNVMDFVTLVNRYLARST